MNTHIETKKWWSANRIIETLFVVLVLLLFSFTQVRSEEMHWYKGNTHTHTSKSDGNAQPRAVTRWYQDNEYNFLILTDHDGITDTKFLDTDGNEDNFILISGNEVSDGIHLYEKGDLSKWIKHVPLHVNGLGLKTPVDGERTKGKTIVDTLQMTIDKINKAGGIAQINHPNYRWAFTDDELFQLKGANLLEILNMNRGNNLYGGGGHKSAEEIWDGILSKGKLWYGVNTDDSHDYLDGEQNSAKFNPGRGWIMVRANELTQEAILSAISRGDFYASTGVTLKDITITKTSYSVEISQFEDAVYTTQYVGNNGKILLESFELKSSYKFTGNEGYVRVRIVDSNNETAFTQPIMFTVK